MKEVKKNGQEKEKTLIRRSPSDNRNCPSDYHNSLFDIFDIL